MLAILIMPTSDSKLSVSNEPLFHALLGALLFALFASILYLVYTAIRNSSKDTQLKKPEIKEIRCPHCYEYQTSSVIRDYRKNLYHKCDKCGTGFTYRVIQCDEYDGDLKHNGVYLKVLCFRNDMCVFNNPVHYSVCGNANRVYRIREIYYNPYSWSYVSDDSGKPITFYFWNCACSYRNELTAKACGCDLEFKEPVVGKAR